MARLEPLQTTRAVTRRRDPPAAVTQTVSDAHPCFVLSATPTLPPKLAKHSTHDSETRVPMGFRRRKSRFRVPVVLECQLEWASVRQSPKPAPPAVRLPGCHVFHPSRPSISLPLLSSRPASRLSKPWSCLTRPALPSPAPDQTRRAQASRRANVSANSKCRDQPFHATSGHQCKSTCQMNRQTSPSAEM